MAPACTIHVSTYTARDLLDLAANRLRQALYCSGEVPPGWRRREPLVHALLSGGGVFHTLAAFDLDPAARPRLVALLERELEEQSDWS
jgi:hypothetical protein